ncbi:MAG: LLM class flavin-dependent oxidoreductase [Alphaproteobacteria bacterium]|nr:LLM class flavin-dependent oxidoreductase [Alphaproteobacteria bacterium]
MSIPVGIMVRNMGTQSTPDLVRHCALEAEAANLDSVYVVDHIAIPPDDAEGSGGRYLDPLSTLAWLGGLTTKIKLGVGILVLPYRPKLPTAKVIATIQELTGNRLELGIGIGWMGPEFKALGVPREKRGAISDDVLRFLHACFGNEVVSENGQDFLFKPRPERPPIFVGGSPPHAIERALEFGDGWFPMGGEPDELVPVIKDYKDRASAANKSARVVTYAGFKDVADFRDRLARLEDIGVDQVMATVKYDTADEFSKGVEGVSAAMG